MLDDPVSHAAVIAEVAILTDLEWPVLAEQARGAAAAADAVAILTDLEWPVLA